MEFNIPWVLYISLLNCILDFSFSNFEFRKIEISFKVTVILEVFNAQYRIELYHYYYRFILIFYF